MPEILPTKTPRKFKVNTPFGNVCIIKYVKEIFGLAPSLKPMFTHELSTLKCSFYKLIMTLQFTNINLDRS